MIALDVLAAYQEHRQILVLSERNGASGCLADALGSIGRKTSSCSRAGWKEASQGRDGKPRLLGPRSWRGHSFHGPVSRRRIRSPNLDTLFLTFPVSWKGTLAQYAGRLHREYYGKTEVIIYDYLDGSVPVLARMHGKRLRGYAAQGYEVER